MGGGIIGAVGGGSIGVLNVYNIRAMGGFNIGPVGGGSMRLLSLYSVSST